MKKFLTATALLVALICCTQTAQAQATSGQKFGFVDLEVIIQQLPEFKQIEARLTALQKSYQDTIASAQTQFQQRLDTYQKQRELMNPDARAQEEQQLGQLRDQILQYQQNTLGQQGLLAQTQAQLLQPVREKVRGAVEKVARDEKLSAVMENSIMIYVDKKLDITYKVLDYLRRGSN